jgi:LPXTG-motif cell wall-anchored protein
VEAIRAAQQDDGSWSWDGSAATAGDTNSTAFALQALAAAGEPTDGQAFTRALDYFGRIQNEDGGWPYQDPSDFGTDTDANSTAVTIQALIALGRDPAGSRWTQAGANTPTMALEALQNASGAFAWQAAIPDDNLLATVQALPALAAKAFPIATMDVGEAQTSAPTTTPQTGGQGVNLALPLLAAGVLLAIGGLVLSRRR